jgi:hypothetical protein
MLCLSSIAIADSEEATGGKNGHEFLGIMMHPYTAFGIDRLSGPDDWATAMKFGIEVNATEGAYVDMSLKLHDILTDEDDEVYEWDSTFSLMVGWYW